MLSYLARTSLFALLLSGNTIAYAALKVGEPAPDFSAVDTRGVSQTLSAYRGKTVVLEWTNHECPYVSKHYGSGNMQRQQAAATEHGVVWLSIISSAPGQQGHVSPREAEQLTGQRNAHPSAVLLDSDGQVGRLYGAKTTPHMYVVDAQGTLRYMGGIDSVPTANPADIEHATQYVEVALAELAAGQPVTTPVSRPYGCSVKY